MLIEELYWLKSKYDGWESDLKGEKECDELEESMTKGNKCESMEIYR